jgi:hypothetical protein
MASAAKAALKTCTYGAAEAAPLQHNLRRGSLGCSGEFFFEALFFEEAGVVAVAREEFVVGSELRDAATDQYRDLVSVACGRDAVRDEDSCAIAHALAKAAEYPLFGVGVDAG